MKTIFIIIYLSFVINSIQKYRLRKKKQRIKNIIDYKQNPDAKVNIEGTFAIKNINQVVKQDNVNVVSQMTQNNYLNNYHTTKVHNYFVYNCVEYSIYTGGRLLKAKDLLKINIDKDCDSMFQ